MLNQRSSMVKPDLSCQLAGVYFESFVPTFFCATLHLRQCIAGTAVASRKAAQQIVPDCTRLYHMLCQAQNAKMVLELKTYQNHSKSQSQQPISINELQHLCRWYLVVHGVQLKGLHGCTG